MYPNVTMPAMLKVADAAKCFHVGMHTLREAVQTGRLPAYTPNGKTQLLKATEVQEWIESHRYRTCRKAANKEGN